MTACLYKLNRFYVWHKRSKKSSPKYFFVIYSTPRKCPIERTYLTPQSRRGFRATTLLLPQGPRIFFFIFAEFSCFVLTNKTFANFLIVKITWKMHATKPRHALSRPCIATAARNRLSFRRVQCSVCCYSRFCIQTSDSQHD